MIRQPIGTSTRIVLGILSFVILIGFYAGLASRQKKVNPQDTTIPDAAQFREGIAAITSNSRKKLVDQWPDTIDPETQQPVMRRRIHIGEFVSAYRAYEPATDAAEKELSKLDANGDERVSFSDILAYLAEVKVIQDSLATGKRLFLGFLVGVVLSFVLGVAMGCFSWIEAFLLPPISFFAKIPPTAMMVIYFVLVGVDLNCFIALIAFGILPTLTQSIYQAAKKDVTEHAINKAYTLGASQFEVVWEVVIQQILPRIIENVRLQVGPAMVFMIAAEMLIAQEGFGYQIRMAQKRTDMNIIYLYLVLLGIGGFLIDWCLSTLRRRMCPWFGD